MGRDEDTLEGVVDQLLSRRGWRLAVTETATTGGMVSQRLTAAGSNAFAGGRVLAADMLEDADARQAAFDLAAESLVDFAVNCALALVADPKGCCTVVVLETPEGRYDWEISFFGTGRRNQVRTSIVSLEWVRRTLADQLDNPLVQT